MLNFIQSFIREGIETIIIISVGIGVISIIGGIHTFLEKKYPHREKNIRYRVGIRISIWAWLTFAWLFWAIKTKDIANWIFFGLFELLITWLLFRSLKILSKEKRRT